MTLDSWLNRSTKSLEQLEIPTARLDVLVLLEDMTCKDRAWLLAHPEFELDNKQLVLLNKQVERRAKHEPLAYIRGKSEFYGREFFVTPATLQPRAETETMVDLLKQIQGKDQTMKGKAILDVGTGSGCLAITAKLEWPEMEVYATEINEDALKVAKKNAKNLQAKIKFYQGNLLEPVYDKCSEPYALLCNLPYVPDAHTINKAAMQEPKVAIFGGSDGLDLYREMFAQIKSKIKPIHILTESLPFQHKDLAAVAKKHGYRLVQTEDFIQVFEQA
jgi:release factor glutamine methyltransferase